MADPQRLPVLGDDDGLVLRPAVRGDADALLGVLTEPEVACWWGPWDAAQVRAELVDGGTPGWAVTLGDVVAGWLEVDVVDDEMYAHVGIDIALGDGFRGRGVGRRAIRTVVRHFVATGHHRFTIDPAVANERAIRTYTALGFRPVGVLRAYERGPDGRWRDGLLMDLLADELVG